MAPRPRSAQTLDDRRSRGTRSYRCRVCRGIHPLRKCSRFLRLSTEKRLRAVLINKYCANCLAHQHSGGQCRSGDACKKCGKDHHTLLHLHEMPRSPRRTPIQPRRQSPSPQRRPAPFEQRRASTVRLSRSVSRSPSPPARQALVRRPAPAATPSVAALAQHQSLHILPTAIVLLESGTTTFETAALIDPCTPVSTIDSSLATAFKLPTTTVGGEEVCSTTIRSRTGDFQIEVLLKISPKLRIRTPIRALTEDMRAQFNDIRLADEQFHRPATVSLVLGSDVYPDVIRPGFLNIRDGLPVAQSTVFGWVLSGACRYA
ncbi:uncharacterized protein LOC122320483 [Drosophila ficusphila]|uniref:uncharacterized protein LOC122320483 n=1 Tax=Drosophila ficusphila TaxID=30025 RepID=UPI001C88F79F|nr:uncharacterized protein LOC122320483 [Drosophila ficusphila]